MIYLQFITTQRNVTFTDNHKGKWWLVSRTLLSLVGDRNQISSLIHAVCSGLLPVLIVIPQNYFVALCKQDEFALCVRITSKGTVDNQRGKMETHTRADLSTSESLNHKQRHAYYAEFQRCIGVICYIIIYIYIYHYLSLERYPLWCTSSLRNSGWGHCCIDKTTASFANRR